MQTSLPATRKLALCIALAFAGAAPLAQAWQNDSAPVVTQRAAPYWQDVTVSSLTARGKAPALNLRRLRTATLDLAGIMSATAAGITTVGIATGLHPDQLIGAGAALGAKDYTDKTLLDLVAEKVLA